MTRWLSLLWAVALSLLTLSPLSLQADPAAPGLAEQHAVRARALFDEGFYRLLPAQSRAEAAARFELAAQENRRAVDLDPANETAYRQLARVYHVQKRFDEESEVQQTLLGLRPEDVDLRVRFADTLTRLGRYPEALAQLQEARGYTDDPHALRQIDRYIELVEQQL